MAFLSPLLLPELILWVATGYIFLAIASLWMGKGAQSSWYKNLLRAPWEPPGWLFGVMWFIMAGLIGVAAFLVWKTKVTVSGGVLSETTDFADDLELWYAAIGLYLAQLLPAALWGMIFFRYRLTGWALVLIVVVTMAAITTDVLFFLISTNAGIIYLFYAVWTLYATLLNGYIWWVNDFAPHMAKHSRHHHLKMASAKSESKRSSRRQARSQTTEHAV